MNHHLIFEGAELAGKSWLMSQVYNHLEPKYNKNKYILDGCHWFNCDIGVFGTKHGAKVIEHYTDIFAELKEKNILAEKLHISDIVYNRLHNNLEVNFSEIEDRLAEMNFKIILICFPEDKGILEKRIIDRLNLYPHYKNILRDTDWYIKQQEEYRQEVAKSKLDSLVIETTTLPDDSLNQKILDWIKESHA